MEPGGTDLATRTAPSRPAWSERRASTSRAVPRGASTRWAPGLGIAGTTSIPRRHRGTGYTFDRSVGVERADRPELAPTMPDVEPRPSTAAVMDLTAMARIRERDERALKEVYDRYAPSMLGIAIRVLQDRTLAEDVLQTVFVRLWTTPERFDPTRGPLRSYLFREAQSRAIDRVRTEEARRAREQRDQREQVLDDDDTEREVLARLRGERVRAAMAELSDGERDAISLAYFAGHSYREVARMLDVPEGTVKSRIRLGLAKLADRMEAQGWEAAP